MLPNTTITELERKIPKDKVRTRFAPSPTGFMHVGNLRTALYTYFIARKLNGKFILRIEDTDTDRYVKGASELIYKTLKNCGIHHDEGPDVGGPAAPYVQSERRSNYAIYADHLISLGGAYRCFCNKSDTHSKYNGQCALLSPSDINNRIAQGHKFVVRQKIPREGSTTFSDAIFGEITVPNNSLDDSILIKSNGMPTYNFANVIDDHTMGITHVVRGSEYLSSAPKYNLLYKTFGWDVPVYIHLPPVMRDKQNKMSKRHGDPSFEDLIEQGFVTDAIVNYVALLGWSPGGERELFSLAELCQTFNINNISKSPAIFDIEKLKHFNSEYIRTMNPNRFLTLSSPYIQKTCPNFNTTKLAELVQSRTVTLTDIPNRISFFEKLPDYSPELYTHKKSKSTPASSLAMLKSTLPILESLDDWSHNTIHSTLAKLAEHLNVKNATLLWPVRIAITGTAVTPGGAVEIAEILGKTETLKRIKNAISMLSTGDNSI